MKDAFNREIKVGDVIVYCTRRGSNQNLNVATVERISVGKYKQEFINAKCFNGTGYDFKHGKWNHSLQERVKISNKNVILRTPKYIMIINGVDVNELRK